MLRSTTIPYPTSFRMEKSQLLTFPMGAICLTSGPRHTLCTRPGFTYLLKVRNSNKMKRYPECFTKYVINQPILTAFLMMMRCKGRVTWLRFKVITYHLVVSTLHCVMYRKSVLIRTCATTCSQRSILPKNGKLSVSEPSLNTTTHKMLIC